MSKIDKDKELVDVICETGDINRIRWVAYPPYFLYYLYFISSAILRFNSIKHFIAILIGITDVTCLLANVPGDDIACIGSSGLDSA